MPESLFNKVAKKETLTQLFSCEFCEIFKNTFFTEQLLTTASVRSVIKNRQIVLLVLRVDRRVLREDKRVLRVDRRVLRVDKRVLLVDKQVLRVGKRVLQVGEEYYK